MLREGLDLPEVSLVAILDADKEGFLRGEKSLIQIIGRAARHIDGQAILYGDKLTDSMIKAIEETERRRHIQSSYNDKNNIIPKSIISERNNPILNYLDISRCLDTEKLEEIYDHIEEISLDKIPELIKQLESKMEKSANQLDFELAAKYRDQIKHFRDKMLGRL